MKEVNRFSFTDSAGNETVRNTVFVDDDGNYHIDRLVYQGGDSKKITEDRKDIHGPMTLQTYTNWLTSLLFSLSYRHSTKEEKKFLLADEKESLC